MGIGIILHTEQADLRVLITVNLLHILWIDAFNMYINIRLS